MSKVDEIIEQLKSLTLLEAADLVKQIEETFDVSAAACCRSCWYGNGTCSWWWS